MDRETIKEQLRANQAVIDDLTAKIKIMSQEISDMNITKGELIAENMNLVNRLRQEEKTPSQILISDHALIRYLERFAGVDIEGMKVALTKELAKTPMKVKNGKIPFKDGLFFVVQNGVVVTISERRIP